MSVQTRDTRLEPTPPGAVDNVHVATLFLRRDQAGRTGLPA